MGGFRAYLLRGNVVDLAVAVVIGAAFGAVISAFVADIITPIIGAIGGTPDFAGLFFTINGSKFMIGHVINTLLSFILIAAIVYYLVVVPVNALMERARPKAPPAPAPPTRECPECLSKVPEAARRCAFCTASLAPVA